MIIGSILVFLVLIFFLWEWRTALISLIAIPLLILTGGSLFAVRGYTLDNGRLIIHRLGWSSRLDLASLVSAVHDPLAMTGSIRIAGNGGLFAFCGYFRNKRLGNYRVFGTDPHRSVVLRFSDQVVVVTPDAPERFVEELTKRKSEDVETLHRR